MTLQHFNTLSENIQHRKLLLNGICLADRITDDSWALLFQIDKFYVEVFFNNDGDEIIGTRCFEDTDELEPYLEKINLSYVV